MEDNISRLPEVGDSYVLSIELVVERDIVGGDVSKVLLSDLVLGVGLGQGIVESVVGILKVGNSIGLGIEVHIGVVKFDSGTVELSVKLNSGGIEAVILVNKGNVGLLKLGELSLGGRKS